MIPMRKDGQEIITEEECVYGCGDIARYKQPSGKLTCSKNPNSCPIHKKRQKDLMLIQWKTKQKYGTKEWIKKNSDGQKKIWNDPNSIFNCKEYKEKQKLKTIESITEETKNKQSDTSKRFWKNISNEIKFKIINATHSEKANKRRSISMIESHKNSSLYNNEWKQKISYSNKGKSKLKGENNPMFGKNHSYEARNKMKIKSKERWNDINFIQKWVASVVTKKPTKPEILLSDKINTYFPNTFKYCGNFTKWIGGKNPDFIWEENNKVIEFFGDYWHSKEITGKCKDVHENERISHFKNFGYDCLTIWEFELKNIENVIEKINLFIGLNYYE